MFSNNSKLNNYLVLHLKCLSDRLLDENEVHMGGIKLENMVIEVHMGGIKLENMVAFYCWCINNYKE